jgi:hypothetical protein
MKIAFDIDGVVLRSIEIILHRVNEATGRSITPDDLLMWDLEPLGLDLDVLRDAVNFMYTQEAIQPYHGAVETLARIHRITGEPLLFITGRSDLEAAARQLRCLPWNPGVPEMIVTGGERDKRRFLRETRADFIIEDDVAYVEEYLDEGIGVGLMIQPWNRTSSARVTERFSGWTELEEWFMQLDAQAEGGG